MKFLTHLQELTKHTVPTLTNAETHLERERERERESATLHNSNGFVTQRVSLMSEVAEEDDDDEMTTTMTIKVTTMTTKRTTIERKRGKQIFLKNKF